MNREEILKQVKSFEEEISREEYKHSAGLKDKLEISPIYDKYKNLFTASNIEVLKKELKDSKEREQKRKNINLYAVLIEGFIGEKLKNLSEKAAYIEATSTVSFGDKKIPFRSVKTLIMNEPSHTKRAKLSKACKPVKEKLTKIEKDAWNKNYELLRQLTGKNYTEFYEELKEVNYEELAENLKKFLIDTNELFTRLMREALESIGVKLEDAKSYDYSYHSRKKEFDDVFTKKNLMRVLKKTLEQLGFDLNKQKNIHIDLKERPKKVPRAFCMSIRIPEEVWLVMKPHGGQDDYQTILHEMGHSQHYANTSKKLAYELKHMGGYAVSETYAFLFEYLLADTAWLKQMTGLNEKRAEKISKFIMFQKLFFTRRYISKIIYEIKLHNNDLTKLDENFKPVKNETYKNMNECYSDILTKAVKVRYEPENWLLDVDEGYYSADYTRAWLMEAQLAAKLKDLFGKKWWKSREAGKYLKNLWKHGSTGLTINELAKKTGYKKLDKKWLEKEIKEVFG